LSYRDRPATYTVSQTIPKRKHWVSN